MKEKVLRAFAGQPYPEPFIWNGSTYATDGTIAIRVKSVVEAFSATQPIYTIENVWPMPNMSKKAIIKRDSLAQCLTKNEVAFAEDDVCCSECGGEGVLNCGHSACTPKRVCATCFGSGEEKKRRYYTTGKKCFGDFLVKIENTHLAVKTVAKIVELAATPPHDGIIELIYCGNPNQPLLFKVGAFEVLTGVISPKNMFSHDGIVNIYFS